jgi:aquaporin Z
VTLFSSLLGDASSEGRRLFSELPGTFFLVLVAVGGIVSTRCGGSARTRR